MHFPNLPFQASKTSTILSASLHLVTTFALLATGSASAGDKVPLSELKSRRSVYHSQGPYFKNLAKDLTKARTHAPIAPYLESEHSQVILDSDDLATFAKLAQLKQALPQFESFSTTDLFLSARLISGLKSGAHRSVPNQPAALPGGISLEVAIDPNLIQFGGPSGLPVPSRECFYLEDVKPGKHFCLSYTSEPKRKVLIETGKHLGRGWGKIIDEVVSLDGESPIYFARALPNFQQKSREEAEIVVSSFTHETQVLQLIQALPVEQRRGIVGIEDVQPLQIVFERFDNELFGLEAVFGPHEKRMLCEDFFSGLRQLHKLRLVHKDLKLENLLVKLGSPPQLAITDFGFTEVLGRSADFFLEKREASGSPSYVAPEILLGKWIGLSPDQRFENAQKADVFAAALNILSLIHGKAPKFMESFLHDRAVAASNFVKDLKAREVLPLLNLFAIQSLMVDPSLSDYGLSQRFTSEQQMQFWQVASQNPNLFLRQDEKPRYLYKREALIRALEGFDVQDTPPGRLQTPGEFTLYPFQTAHSPALNRAPDEVELAIKLKFFSGEEKSYLLTDLHPEFPRESLAIYLHALHVAGWIRWQPSPTFEFGPDKTLATSIWNLASNSPALFQSKQPRKQQPAPPVRQQHGLKRLLEGIRTRLASH